MKQFFLFIAFVFAAVAPAIAAPDDDFLIVAGERVGRITADASEDSLRSLYGDDRVESVLIARGEGFVCKGSRVRFDAGDYLEVTWLDTEAKALPDLVYVNGPSWRTREGVGLGISLRQLEAINGGPFRLMGFEWDYGGTIVSWDDGRLEGETREMWLALSPDPEAYQRVTIEEAEKVAGEIEFSSDHPVMQKLNPRLRSLAIDLALRERCLEFDAE